jgi:23S rRNA (guanosine2251-2'-O)-methyltransferase
MAGEDYLEVQFNPAIALVIGAEGRGLSRLVKNSCAKLVSIPLKGRIGSLNASVSAGILLFHIASKRRQ